MRPLGNFARSLIIKDDSILFYVKFFQLNLRKFVCAFQWKYLYLGPQVKSDGSVILVAFVCDHTHWKFCKGVYFVCVCVCKMTIIARINVMKLGVVVDVDVFLVEHI